MKKFVALICLAVVGCASTPETQKIDVNKPEMARAGTYARKFSSGYVGCDPRKITIKNLENENFPYESLQTWQAICDNEIYYCSMVTGSRTMAQSLGIYQHAHCSKSKS